VGKCKHVWQRGASDDLRDMFMQLYAWSDYEYCSYCRNFRERPLVTKTGKVLTEEDISRLADEAEEGYDVSNLKDRGVPQDPSG